jgi:alcohol dehydrogenase class IV
LRSPAPFDHTTLAGRVVFAPGDCAERLQTLLEEVGASRVLVIATEAERALAEDLTTPLGDRRAGVFGEARPHVPVETAGVAVAMASDVGADWVVSIGGGSTTGTAKAVALELGLPILAVPTTYAGSEMTPVWGLTDGARKTTGHSFVVQPKIVLYDPELTIGLPAATTATSVVNALAHCVEAFYAPAASPLSGLLAEEGIRALIAGSAAVVAPDDLEARGVLLYGACLAGSAFAHAGSDLHHKICHVLGGAFDLPHAETHTAMLPQVVAFVEPALPDDVRERLAAAFAVAPEGTVAATIFDLAESFGASMALREFGMTAGEVDVVVEPILKQVPASTPRPPDREDLRRILQAALDGTAPSRNRDRETIDA